MESYIVEVNNTEYEVTIRDNNGVKKPSKDQKTVDDVAESRNESSKNNINEHPKDNEGSSSSNSSTVTQNKNFNKKKGIEINSPMTGKILSIKVQKGDIVKKNKVIITLEAMKMETEIVSPVEGKVIEILTSEGSKCKQGETLIIIEDGGS